LIRQIPAERRERYHFGLAGANRTNTE